MKKPVYQIIFEDDALVLVNKSPFLLSIPDRYAPEKPNLFAQLNKKFGKVYIVHRLDKETSGILVFAKNETAHKILSRQFERHTTEKIYYALLEGHLHNEEGIIDKALAPSSSSPFRMQIHYKGKPSLTAYRVVERFRHFTLVEAAIKTGRMHQIRVHFQSIGYPLAVDRLYGRRGEFLLSEVKGRRFKNSKGLEERPLMARSSLHAFQLSLNHPITGERHTWEAALPKDFKAVLNQLRKWGQ